MGIFGVSKPTIRAAIQCYLTEHPDAKDEVNLASGGAKPVKFDIEKFADEARQLFENGWAKLKLAEKYGCSTPVIDKALALAYEQVGLPMPTREDRQNIKSAEARRMLEQAYFSFPRRNRGCVAVGLSIQLKVRKSLDLD